MNAVFIITPDKKSEADAVVKGDDIISRQSIILRSADSLGLGAKLGNVYVLIVEGSDVAVKKAEELLKDIAKKTDNPDEILEKIKADEDNAVAGFGNIFG